MLIFIIPVNEYKLDIETLEFNSGATSITISSRDAISSFRFEALGPLLPLLKLPIALMALLTEDDVLFFTCADLADENVLLLISMVLVALLRENIVLNVFVRYD